MALSGTVESEFEKAKNDMFALPDDDNSDEENGENNSHDEMNNEYSGLGLNDDTMSAMSGMTGDTTVGNRSHLVSGGDSGGGGGSDNESDDMSNILNDKEDDEFSSEHETGSNEKEKNAQNAAGLEWTMRTTGGESRGQDSLVRMGSIQTDEGFPLGIPPTTTDSSYGNAPWASQDSANSEVPPPPTESTASSQNFNNDQSELPAYLQSPPALSILPSYLQSPNSPPPSSSLPPPSSDSQQPNPNPIGYPLTNESEVSSNTSYGTDSVGFPPSTKSSTELPSSSAFAVPPHSSPPPSPPPSPPRNNHHRDINTIQEADHSHEDDEPSGGGEEEMGNTETQFEQMIRDAEGNALLFAEIKADAVKVLENNAQNKLQGAPLAVFGVQPGSRDDWSNQSEDRYNSDSVDDERSDLSNSVQESFSHLHIRAAAAAASAHFEHGPSSRSDTSPSPPPPPPGQFDQSESEEEPEEESNDSYHYGNKIGGGGQNMIKMQAPSDVDFSSAVMSSIPSNQQGGLKQSVNFSEQVTSLEAAPLPVEQYRGEEGNQPMHQQTQHGRDNHISLMTSHDSTIMEQPASDTLVAIYKRAKYAMKKKTGGGGGGGGSVQGVDGCVDLWSLAGLNPSDSEHNVLTEMRRIYLSEQPNHQKKNVMEQIAVEVLGRDNLRSWYDSMRKEAVIRERLLHQYQAECDHLAKDMGKLKQQRKADLLEAEKRAKGMNGDPLRLGEEHRAAKAGVRASAEVLRSELNANAATAAVTEQLHETETQVRELTVLVDTLKNEKRALLLKCEGLDEQQMAKEDSLVRRYKAELDRERDLHKHQITQLENKLTWYVENQSLVDGQVDKIMQLKEENTILKTALEKKNENYDEAAGSGGGGARKALAVKERRIKNLEQQLKQLTEASERNPYAKSNKRDPLLDLIHATKPSEEFDQKLKLLKLRNSELEEELEGCRQDSALALRSLKQQFHQLQLKYQDTVSSLDIAQRPKSTSLRQSSSNALSGAGSNNGRAVVVKLAEAEAKVDQLTRALAKKGQYMESRIKAEKEKAAKQMAALKSQMEARRRHDHNPFAAFDDQGGGGQQRNQSFKEGPGDQGTELKVALQEAIAEKQALQQDLKYAMGELESQRRQKFGPFNREDNQSHQMKKKPHGDQSGEQLQLAENKITELSDELTKLTEQYQTEKIKLETQNNALHSLLAQFQYHNTHASGGMNHHLPPPPPPPVSSHVNNDEEIVQLKGKVTELQTNSEHLLKQINKYRDQIIQLEKEKNEMISEYQKEVFHLNDSNLILKQKIQKQQLSFAQELNMKANEYAKKLALDPNTILTNKCEELSRKIESMQLRNSLREQSITSAITMSQEQGKLEMKRMQSIHAAELAEKDDRIECFRNELDSLLTALASLQPMMNSQNKGKTPPMLQHDLDYSMNSPSSSSQQQHNQHLESQTKQDVVEEAKNQQNSVDDGVGGDAATTKHHPSSTIGGRSASKPPSSLRARALDQRQPNGGGGTFFH